MVAAGFGGWLAFNNIVTVGIVVAFLTYVDRFFRPVQQLSALYTQMQAAFAASERIFELLDTAPDLTDQPSALPLPPIKGDLRFENVSFGYDPEDLILKNVSFEARQGETIAIVGPTGAGKSINVAN